MTSGKGNKARKTMLDDDAGSLILEVSQKHLSNKDLAKRRAIETGGYAAGDQPEEGAEERVHTRNVGNAPPGVRRTPLTDELYAQAIGVWRDTGSIEFAARRLGLDPKTMRKAVYGPMPRGWEKKKPIAKALEEEADALMRARIEQEARNRRAAIAVAEKKAEEKAEILRFEAELGQAVRKSTAGALRAILKAQKAIERLAEALESMIEEEIKAKTLKAKDAVKILRDYVAATAMLAQQMKTIIEARKIAESEPVLEAAFASAESVTITSIAEAEQVVALASKAMVRAQALGAGASALLAEAEEGTGVFAVREGSADPRDFAKAEVVKSRPIQTDPMVDDDEEDMIAEAEDADDDRDPDEQEVPFYANEYPPKDGTAGTAADAARQAERRRVAGLVRAVREEQEEPMLDDHEVLS